MTRLPAAIATSIMCLVLGTACTPTTSEEPAQRPSLSSGLHYDQNIRGPVPIPPSERDLQTATAREWFTVSHQGWVLEGAIFDPAGNMLFCDVTGRRVLRLTPGKELSTVVALNRLSPGGLAFGRDGRLFIAAMDLTTMTGAVMAVHSDGTDLQTVVPPRAGYLPNDLVFDAAGGFYFTDFRGTANDDDGAVLYTSPDLKTTQAVLRNLRMANGVALSLDGKRLWVTEFGRNLLHRVDLANAVTPTTLGTAIPYHFTGPAPDSMRVDADGNVYVAIYGQGRVLIFNPLGIPIGQVLLPEREQGHNLQSTSMAIRPGTQDLYVVSSDGEGGQGANIFTASAFAPALPPTA